MGSATTSGLTGQCHPKNPQEGLGCQQLPVWIKHYEPEKPQIRSAVLPLILRVKICMGAFAGNGEPATPIISKRVQVVSSTMKAPYCFKSVNVLPAAKDLTGYTYLILRSFIKGQVD